MNTASALKKKDFESGQEVRWCPGCGDYSILASVQRLLPELGVPKENHVFISGIGCSSRFPYYMNTYGFHTIHGRAPALASGTKICNPDLKVWIITGDGDGLSIGGNHLIHLLRRNVDVTILLFNNQIYGLTKGQYSPTSEIGKVTKSTPFGSLDAPINPLALALGAGATFVGRALDVDAKGLSAVLKQASDHKGTSLVEIYQNCNVFNDGAHHYMSDRSVRDIAQVQLQHEQPLLFGAEKERAIELQGLELKNVATDQGTPLIFDQHNKQMAFMMAQTQYPEFPVPMGVLYVEERPTYDDTLWQQVEQAKEKKGPGDLQALLNGRDSWTVA